MGSSNIYSICYITQRSPRPCIVGFIFINNRPCLMASSIGNVEGQSPYIGKWCGCFIPAQESNSIINVIKRVIINQSFITKYSNKTENSCLHHPRVLI